MAAEQPFLQNASSGLSPACKPKLQQAGVYYLVWHSVKSTHVLPLYGLNLNNNLFRLQKNEMYLLILLLLPASQRTIWHGSSGAFGTDVP